MDRKKVLSQLLLVVCCFSLQTVEGTKCTANTTAMDIVKGMNLANKVYVITGGDSGLGYANAMALASVQARIIILSYDVDGSGAAAAANITNATGNTDISLVQIDLSNFTSVKLAAENVLLLATKIDVVICDAGLGSYPRSLSLVTKDGFDRIWQVNLLGHVLLNQLLLPAVRKSSGRFIMVASDSSMYACAWGNLPNNCTDIENIASHIHEPPPGAPDAINSLGVNASDYGLSKFAEIFWTSDFARRQANSSVIAVSLHPGFVWTPMAVRYITITTVAFLKYFIAFFDCKLCSLKIIQEEMPMRNGALYLFFL
eukprot:m.128390 g.128390  ORF g.128390 m.128390 type:complete len:314 (-) comp14559_c0_seq28:412-1353(-)